MTKRKKEGEVGAGVFLKKCRAVSKRNHWGLSSVLDLTASWNPLERQYKYNSAAVQAGPQLSYDLTSVGK